MLVGVWGFQFLWWQLIKQVAVMKYIYIQAVSSSVVYTYFLLRICTMMENIIDTSVLLCHFFVRGTTF